MPPLGTTLLPESRRPRTKFAVDGPFWANCRVRKLKLFAEPQVAKWHLPGDTKRNLRKRPSTANFVQTEEHRQWLPAKLKQAGTVDNEI